MDAKITSPYRRLDDNALRQMITPTSRKALFKTLPVVWWRRFVQRRQMARDLQSFPPEVLEDFGLSYDEANALVNKPFWRA